MVEFFPRQFDSPRITNFIYLIQAVEDIISILSNKKSSLPTLHYLLEPLYSTPTYRLNISCDVMSKHHLPHHHTSPQILIRSPNIF